MSFVYNEKYFRRHYSSQVYRYYLTIRNRFIKSEISKLVSLGKFLEVGFGDDNLIKLFANNFDVFGIDISKFAVRKIKDKYNPSHFKACDVSKENIPFREKFTVVCAINVLEHLGNPKFALQTIFKSLKKNGILVVYLPTQSNILSRWQYKIFYDVKEHVFRPSVKTLRELLEEVGFKLHKEYAASSLPLKVSHKLVLESFNLYLGFWQRRTDSL